jgi:hypothetical protein
MYMCMSVSLLVERYARIHEPEYAAIVLTNTIKCMRIYTIIMI